MTRKEAIKHLLEIQDEMPFDECRDWINAIYTAIRCFDAWDTIESQYLKERIDYDKCTDFGQGYISALAWATRVLKRVVGE